MSDRIFYVGAHRIDGDREFTGYVPSKFLNINGQPVVDPTPGGSQDAYIYADPSNKIKVHGAYANPNNYVIVPEKFNEQQARNYAAQIANIQKIPVIGGSLALGKMALDFTPVVRKTCSATRNGAYQMTLSSTRMSAAHRTILAS